MHPVRQAILEILKRNGHATVGELADKLEMAPVSVRHHLDLLIGDDLVCTPRVRRSPGAGRPQRVYALTDSAGDFFPNNYRQLADSSLQALKDILSKEELLAVMDELARQHAEKAGDSIRSLPLDKRIEAVAEILSAQGYMAEVDQDPDGIVLHTCNCPYAELSTPHSELCHMDLQLVCRLTGVEPQRVAHIVEGDGRCSYRFQPSDPPAPSIALYTNSVVAG